MKGAPERGYEDLVEAGRIASASPPPDVPDFAVLRGRFGQGRGGETHRRRRAVAIVVSVALAAGVAGFVLYARPAIRDDPPVGIAALVDGPLVGATPGTLLSGVGAITSSSPVPMRPGQTLRTSQGRARVIEPRTATVLLDPATALRMDAWDDRATRLWLEDGRIDVAVEHRAPGQTFEVWTPYATIRVVGTRFVVTQRPGEGTEVQGIEGRVSVLDGSGNAVAFVVAGQVVRIGSGGQVIESPTAIASAPGAGANAPAAPEDITASAAAIETVVAPNATVAAPAAAIETVVAPNATVAAPAVPNATVAAPVSAAVPGPVPAPVPVPVPEPVPEPALVPASRVVADIRRMLADGQDDAAIGELARALQRSDVDRSTLLALLGDAHRLAGRPDQARIHYERAIAEAGAGAAEGVFSDLAGLYGKDLGQPARAAATWQAYLASHPSGRFAPRAMAELADLALASGDVAQAEHHWRRLCELRPGAPEAVVAFIRVGRANVDRGDLDVAAAWYSRPVPGASADLAEAALVGLMSVRLTQGRVEDVRRLAAEHATRFPKGARGAEVERVLAKVR